MKMRVPALTALALAACSPAPSPQRPVHPGSRGLHADEHLDAAREHERRAQELARWPETRTAGSGAFDAPQGGLWYRRWDTADEEAKLAASHRGAAADLHAQYEEACGSEPAEKISISPLQRYGIGGTNIDDGVLIFLRAEAGRPDALLKDIRCHRAWMMLSESGMGDCPLDLTGINVVAHGDTNGVSVSITVKDPKLVPELQRRAAHDLEAASHQHAEH